MKFIASIIAASLIWSGVFTQALEASESSSGVAAEVRKTASASLNLASASLSTMLPEKVLPSADAKAVVSRAKTEYGTQSRQYIVALWKLGESYTQEGEHAKAWTNFRNAASTARKLEGDTVFAGELYMNLGHIAVYQRRITTAIKQLKKAAAIFEQLDGQAANLGTVRFWEGKLAYLTGRESKAIDAFRLAADHFSQAANTEMQLSCVGHIFRAYTRLGDEQNASAQTLLLSQLADKIGADIYQPIFTRRPTYPDHQRRTGQTGSVVIEMTIDENGYVKNPNVVELNGHSAFGRAALDAIAQFRYIPRYVSGVPVETSNVRFRFQFSLV